MVFAVIAKRSGDSVAFEVDAEDTVTAYQRAKIEANRIFGYKPGELSQPTVSVKPIEEKE